MIIKIKLKNCKLNQEQNGIFWPNKVGDNFYSGNSSVELLEETKDETLTKRKMNITSTGYQTKVSLLKFFKLFLLRKIDIWSNCHMNEVSLDKLIYFYNIFPNLSPTFLTKVIIML